MISGRSDRVWLVKGYNCSEFGAGGEVWTQVVFLVGEIKLCYAKLTNKVLNPCSTLQGYFYNFSLHLPIEYSDNTQT